MTYKQKVKCKRCARIRTINRRNHEMNTAYCSQCGKTGKVKILKTYPVKKKIKKRAFYRFWSSEGWYKDFKTKEALLRYLKKTGRIERIVGKVKPKEE